MIDLWHSKNILNIERELQTNIVSGLTEGEKVTPPETVDGSSNTNKKEKDNSSFGGFNMNGGGMPNMGGDRPNMGGGMPGGRSGI